MNMELVTKDEHGLAVVPVSTTSGSRRSRPRNVLNEDAYVENLEKIIERDFFPDLEKMNAQKEYLEAVEKDDRVKMRALLVKYGPKARPFTTPSEAPTPATFDTPSTVADGKLPERASAGNVPNPTINPEIGEDKSGETQEDTTSSSAASLPGKKGVASDLSLDKYLNKFVSEDNESFEKLMEESERKRRVKHAWLYEQEEEQDNKHEAQLALPSYETQALTDTNSSAGQVDTWKYKAINEVMYVPKGVELTSEERLELASKEKAIVHENTRFVAPPFDLRASNSAVHQAAAAQSQAIANQGRVGADGKELMPSDTPKVGGYGFVATPSPAPGVIDASPLMTWGEIEGTPFRLDGGDTPAPSTPGPQFKIPNVPKRDTLAFSLAEKASAQHRKKKEEALRTANATFRSPSPSFGSSKSIDRLRNMSPAAQRLASSKLGVRVGTDKALMQSYTPSPSRTPQHQRTPILTSARSSARSSRRSATTTPDHATPITRTKKQVDESLTDNLLHLPISSHSNKSPEKRRRIT